MDMASMSQWEVMLNVNTIGGFTMETSELHPAASKYKLVRQTSCTLFFIWVVAFHLAFSMEWVV